MEVWEVMFFAITLWFCLVGFLFTLVFGKDVIRYLKASGRCTETSAFKQENRSAPTAIIEHKYEDAVARKGERDLVLK